MRAQAIKDLKNFYRELVDTEEKFRSVNEDYELFECAGNYVQDLATTIFVRTKNTKKVFMFNTFFGEEGNAARFERLMKELEE